MHTYLSETLKKLKHNLELTANHYLAEHALLVTQAQKTLDTVTDAARATKPTGKKKQGERQTAEVKKAADQLVTLEQTQKSREESFQKFRDALNKVVP